MNSLRKRPLGSSGLEITTVGFGAWALGGGDWSYGWGPQDDNASIATMRHALELGVNWIDTAAIELTTEDLKEIEVAIERTGAAGGSVLPQARDTKEAA